VERKRTNRTRLYAGLAGLLLLALGGGLTVWLAQPLLARYQSAHVAATATLAPPTASPSFAPTATPLPLPPPRVAGDWSTYLGGSAHTSYNADETALNPRSAPRIVQPWAGGDGLSITGDLVEANGLVYLGFWNGDLRAWEPTTGQVRWNRYLGQTTMPNCTPRVTGLGNVVGVAGTPTAVTVHGRKLIIVGGGDAQLYALDALTGKTVWHTRLGASPAQFLWSSPVYDYITGDVYIGIASFGDCVSVRGGVVQADAWTGSIVHTANLVPETCTGAEVLGAPTLDVNNNLLFVATGEAGKCGGPEAYASSVVALSALDLGVRDAWQVPAGEAAGGTTAFGATPTLFSAPPSHRLHQMVGVANRNGVFYAFDQYHLSAGPVWRAKIADGGTTALRYVPGSSSGMGSVAPASWDGTRLYVAGGQTTIRGQRCRGSVRALAPSDGSVVWERCLQTGPVVGAPASSKGGVVVAGAGDVLYALSSATGSVLYAYLDPEYMPFGSGASIAHGWIYIGNVDGGMHAYTV
jgi:outer membrane protein assembly factor BamB